MKPFRIAIAVCALAVAFVARAATPDPAFDADLLAVQQAWAHANYEVPAGDAREQAFGAVEKQAAAFVAKYPGRAEPLIWAGIVESSYAGAKGGIGALGLAKKARASLEAALKINPTALDGSAYTSLGTLYFKVPGFPLGFGDDDKARDLLQKALKLNPNGIDPNYFYADFLIDQGEYKATLPYLERAAQAPARPGREVADQGRHAEINALIAKVRKELG